MEWNALVALLKVVLIHTVDPYKMYPSNVLVSRFADDATGGTRSYASRMDVLLSFSYSFRFLLCARNENLVELQQLFRFVS